MTRKNVWFASLATPVVIAMLLLFAGSPRVTANDQPPAANAVKIDNFVFGPKTITVPVGTTVTWTNSDDIPHTDENFSYTFTKAGTYSYFCSIHPKMTGQVVVK